MAVICITLNLNQRSFGMYTRFWDINSLELFLELLSYGSQMDHFHTHTLQRILSAFNMPVLYSKKYEI